MKLLLVAAVVLAAILHSTSGLFLGLGGVYNSPEAQEYWNQRYGKDIFRAARQAAKMYYQRSRPEKPKTTTTPAPTQRVFHYVPMFQGTYSEPSPYLVQFQQRQTP